MNKIDREDKENWMSTFVSNPTDTALPSTNISFSALKNTFGSSATTDIKLSEFTVPIVSQLGTSSNLASFANKRLPDPVVSVTFPITFVSKVYTTDPSNPTLAMGTAYPFRRLDNYKFITTNLTATFNQNPYQAQFTTLNASTNTSPIAGNGIPTTVYEYNNSIVPIVVNIRKRNNFSKPIYSANVNASQIVFPYHLTVSATAVQSPITHHHFHNRHNYSSHHHGSHNRSPHHIHHGDHVWSHDLPGGYGARHNHHAIGRHSGHHTSHHHHNHHANHHNLYNHTQTHNFYTSSAPNQVTAHNSDIGTNAQVASYFALTSIFQSASSTCTSESSHTFNSGCTSKYKARITLPWNSTQLLSTNDTSINLTASVGTTSSYISGSTGPDL